MTLVDRDAFCPACATRMTRRRVRGIHLDLCPDCAGVWFDRGELESFVGSGAPAPSPVPEAGPAERGGPIQGESEGRSCPRCRALLRTEARRGVRGHACGEHGVFVEDEAMATSGLRGMLGVAGVVVIESPLLATRLDAGGPPPTDGIGELLGEGLVEVLSGLLELLWP